MIGTFISEDPKPHGKRKTVTVIARKYSPSTLFKELTSIGFQMESFATEMQEFPKSKDDIADPHSCLIV